MLKFCPDLVLGQPDQFGTPVLADACRTRHSDRIDVARNLHGRAYSAAQRTLAVALAKLWS